MWLLLKTGFWSTSGQPSERAKAPKYPNNPCSEPERMDFPQTRAAVSADCQLWDLMKEIDHGFDRQNINGFAEFERSNNGCSVKPV